MWRALAIVALTAAVARAHVAPSLNDNNRYLKLTPLGDRVRLAYTVFFGEVPGEAARREIDADHDGAISDAEAKAFGDRLAAEVAPALTITVDGAPAPIAWTTVDVGMNQPVTAAGSFSVDLVAWLCLPSQRGRHTVVLRDRFAVPRPGENELRVEDTPGVHVEVARLGGIDLADLDARWMGAGGALVDPGFTLTFDAGDKAPILNDHACKAAPPAPQPSSSSHATVITAVVVVLVAGVIVALLLVRRRLSRSVTE